MRKKRFVGTLLGLAVTLAMLLGMGTQALAAVEDDPKEDDIFTYIESDPVDVSDVSLDQDSTTILVNGTEMLTANVEPAEATDKTVKWSVSDGSVVLYSDAECNNEVGTDVTDTLVVYAKGMSEGGATVTVTSNADATKAASCDVTVATPYPVWVGDAQVTSASLSGEGWSYDADANTLTLTNFTSGSEFHAFQTWSSSANAAIYAQENLTVRLEGENSIENMSTVYYPCGIYCAGDLAIEGNGSLTATTPNDSSNYGYGIYTKGSLSIDNATVTASGYSAFYADDDITINNSTVNADAKTNSYGMYTETNIKINGSTVNAYGYYEGIENDYGDVKISGSTVNASADYYEGICVYGTLAIDDSDVTATASQNDEAIYAYQLEMNSGTLICTGEYGIYVDYNARFNGGTVVATGIEDNGIYVDYNARFNGGDVTAVGYGTYAGVYANAIMLANKMSVKAGDDEASAMDVTSTFAKDHGQPWVHITKLAPAEVTTAPTAKDLVADGSAQELVTEGAASGGSMQYVLGKDADKVPTKGWDASIPTGTDYGTYYVWYKAAGDRDHTDSDPACVEASISKTPAAAKTAPTARDLTYTGSAQKLVSAGTAEGGTMQYSLDGKTFSAAVPTATKAGTYTVWYKAVGDDDHADSEAASVKATIARAPIAKAKVTLKTTSYAYDGTKKEPGVKSVVLNGKKLKAGSDYVVSYKNNKKAGTATATVTGKGNYKGSAKATFSIKLAKTRLETVGKTAKSGFLASWDKIAGAKGYELQWRKAGGKWKSVTVKGTSKLVDGLEAGGLYQFRVRAVAGEAKAPWSNVSGRYLAKVKGVSATVKKSGAVTATWQADPKANAGYVVVVRYEQAGSIVARASVPAGKTSATVKGLGKGKKPWVEVRSVRKSDGKTYAGVLSGTWAE